MVLQNIIIHQPIVIILVSAPVCVWVWRLLGRDTLARKYCGKLCEAAKDPRNHRYSASKGIKNLRVEIAKKYEKNWNVSLDPETEVLACIGSKEGFSHLCLAMMGPGDTAIVPDPSFPI
ncbi:unnamed protein product, partial [marine sediment metagenome]